MNDNLSNLLISLIGETRTESEQAESHPTRQRGHGGYFLLFVWPFGEDFSHTERGLARATKQRRRACSAPFGFAQGRRDDSFWGAIRAACQNSLGAGKLKFRPRRMKGDSSTAQADASVGANAKEKIGLLRS